MVPLNLIRLGGLAAITGGVLLLVGTFVFLVGHPFLYYLGFPVRDYTALYVFYGVSSTVALMLVPVGMAGFHVLQGHGYGREGRAGLWWVVAGSLAVVLGGVVFFTLGESGDFLQATSPWALVWMASGLLVLVVGLVGLVAGFASYGVATLQARVLPRWCGAAFIAVLPVALASIVLGIFLRSPWAFFSQPIVFGLVWLTLGYALWSRRVTATQRPS